MRTRIVAAAFAVMIVVVFVALHAAGARDAVGLLSGTRASDLELLVGLGYVLAWFGFVLVVPIALIALILDGLCERIIARWPGSRRP